jgi:hypothetical protein
VSFRGSRTLEKITVYFLCQESDVSFVGVLSVRNKQLLS